MAGEAPVPPPVLWAQRKEVIFLTFSVETKDPTIKIEKESVYFKGVNIPNNKAHEVTIQLHDAIIPENSSFVNKGRCIEMVLKKEKTDAAYWPSLTKDRKPHYLKIDFNKWKDEDDEDEAAGGGGGDYDIEDMLRSMGQGAEDKGGKPVFDDMESDSDDENLPDLE
ncbi:unnamed protein product [Danaus chrysippus]|uniref:(African queen) hypothetical protein n=1 Tax=Danaus chrysippus TaxID=151541 RepID=A0A8J2WBA4_9NEOP|nr:unnamed protein product [Danaus chrysippus]